MKRTHAFFLGIDTATAWGSLGLIDGTHLLASMTFEATRGHAQGLPDRVATLLQGAGIEPDALAGIGVVNGPGSFTALRVGVSFAQGLGTGLGIPVVPVGSHEAVAAAIPPLAASLLVVIPARKNEVFTRLFQRTQPASGSNNSVSYWDMANETGCFRVDEIGGLITQASLVSGPALETYPEEFQAMLGDRYDHIPSSLRHSRGETVALLARERIIHGNDWPAETVKIHYLQSHGAQTIEERERKKGK
jgi:tRNA threonylcarbamoyladenosine biosynthesis protein TsaB